MNNDDLNVKQLTNKEQALQEELFIKKIEKIDEENTFEVNNYAVTDTETDQLYSETVTASKSPRARKDALMGSGRSPETISADYGSNSQRQRFELASAKRIKKTFYHTTKQFELHKVPLVSRDRRNSMFQSPKN